jgi:hypothetical protein
MVILQALAATRAELAAGQTNNERYRNSNRSVK